MSFAFLETEWMKHRERGRPSVPIFTPNSAVTEDVYAALATFWILLWLAWWILYRSVILPSPWDVFGALPNLWFNEGLGQQLIASVRVNLEALVLSTAVGLPLAYLSRVPILYPLSFAASKLRVLSPVVFFLLLLFVSSGGHALKVYMLTLGEVFFLITSVMTIVHNVPAIALDDARTLRMDEWQVLWYAVVRDTLPQVIDAIRDNAAMGFAMLLMVEGIVRSEGGIGILFIDQEKHFNFAEVYAIAGVILVTGIGQDLLLSGLRRGLCPWAVRKR